MTRLDLDGVDVDLERGTDMRSNGNFAAFAAQLDLHAAPQGRARHGGARAVHRPGRGQQLIRSSRNGWLPMTSSTLMIYSTNMSAYTSELAWWTGTEGLPKDKPTWGVEFTSQPTVDMAKAKLATASKAYGGVMVWEYSQNTEPQLWPGDPVEPLSGQRGGDSATRLP